MDQTNQSTNRRIELSPTEWVVLGLLAEGPAHGFAVAKELRAGTDLGRIMTVHRPLVYRALDRLVAAELVEHHHTEPGDAGPNRTLHRPTRRGRGAVNRWLDRPVGHIRELRIEFLLKLRLNERRSRDSTKLITKQRRVLEDTMARLTCDPGTDVVDLWRSHNARAAKSFLDDLNRSHH
ncbi:MAG: PadR family transcriptional regulator [Actinomycetia bacterium]|nr:PadR family transcriptional regulator [Actinomycetes bacterium]MCP4959553.1 PadR family transcriptional regulator [Actinomycetes bacterium]